MANAILALHSTFFYIVLVAGALTLLCGITLLFAFKGAKASSGVLVVLGERFPVVLRLFRILLSATAAIGVLQAIFGIVLYTEGFRPHDQLHFVYGAIVALAIPVAYAYSDQKQVRRDIIIMAIAAVAIIGAAVRAFMTGA